MKKTDGKKKLLDRTAVITTLVCLLPIVMGLIVYQDLPDRMAVHWGVSEEANGWMSKQVAVWLLPLFMAALNLICHIATNADPKQEGHSQTLLKLVKWFPAVLSLVMMSMVLLMNLGREISVAMVCCILVGVVLIVIGNYMPKCRQNYTMGIKLPWTLSDEDNWNSTHRLAGPLYMLAGVVFLLMGVFPQLAVVGLVIAAVLFLTPVVYSFLLSRKKA